MITERESTLQSFKKEFLLYKGQHLHPVEDMEYDK